MSVSKDPMIAITSPLQMSMFAMNLSRSLGASCNQCEHGSPMIAIMATDDCEQLQLCFPAEALAHSRATMWPGEFAPWWRGYVRICGADSSKGSGLKVHI